jgi:hypothetical protein
VSSSNAKQLVKRAEEIRDREHRLKPSLRLKTQEEIYQFIHDKGLVSALGGNELPSFISAIIGRPWKPSAKGFTGWTDWWSIKIDGKRIARVSREIEEKDDILATRVFRRTKTFVAKELWPVLGSIVEYHQDPPVKRKILSELELELLETIESEGSIRTDRLRKKLGLEPKENNSKFHRSLANLESYALIIGIGDPHPERHLHANIWRTWNNRTRGETGRVKLSYSKALVSLLETTIDACIFAREDQMRKWFRWSSEMEVAKEDLVKSERITRSGPFLVSTRVQGD